MIRRQRVCRLFEIRGSQRSPRQRLRRGHQKNVLTRTIKCHESEVVSGQLNHVLTHQDQNRKKSYP